MIKQTCMVQVSPKKITSVDMYRVQEHKVYIDIDGKTTKKHNRKCDNIHKPARSRACAGPPRAPRKSPAGPPGPGASPAARGLAVAPRPGAPTPPAARGRPGPAARQTRTPPRNQGTKRRCPRSRLQAWGRFSERGGELEENSIEYATWDEVPLSPVRGYGCE